MTLEQKKKMVKRWIEHDANSIMHHDDNRGVHEWEETRYNIIDSWGEVPEEEKQSIKHNYTEGVWLRLTDAYAFASVN